MPLYPAFAVYVYVDALSLFSVPCVGLCEMLVLFTAPSILMGNRHVPPEATLKYLSSQCRNWIVFLKLGTPKRRAPERAPKPGTATMNAKATTRENRIVGSPCFRISRALALSDYSTNLGKSELCNYAVSDTRSRSGSKANLRGSRQSRVKRTCRASPGTSVF